MRWPLFPRCSNPAIPFLMEVPMSSLCNRVTEKILEVALMGVGLVILSLIVVPQQGCAEAAGCANNYCHMIKYFQTCGTNGHALEMESCIFCTPDGGQNTLKGRCNGKNVACSNTQLNNGQALTTVTTVCDCPASFANANGNVEATGNYNGDYLHDDSVPKIWMWLIHHKSFASFGTSLSRRLTNRLP